MKRNSFYLLMTAILCLLRGCTQEVLVPEQEILLGRGTYATVPDIEFTTFDGTAATQTRVSIDPSSLAFAWTEGDEIGVVPMDGKTGQTNFTVKDIRSDAKSCSFDGGAWTLKENLSYCAYYPFTASQATVTSNSNVRIKTYGQYQMANGDASHLSDYLYMYSEPVTNTDGTVNFQFKHLSSIVNFIIKAPATATYSSLSISSQDQIFATGAFKLSDGSISVSENKSREFTINLNDIDIEEDEDISVFAALFPWEYEMTDKRLNVVLTDSEGNTYTYHTQFGKMTAGKGYQLYCKSTPSTAAFSSVISLKQAIADAGYDFSKINNIRIVTGEDGSEGTLVNGDLPDEEALYVLYAFENAPILMTMAQKIKLPKSCAYLFNFENLISISDWTSDKIDASQVTAVDNMFYECKSITSIDLDFLSGSSGITTTNHMFYGCKALKSVDMSALSSKMSKVADMEDMFTDCSSLESVDLSGWSTPSLTKCDRMFYECSSLTDVNLTNLNTRNVSRMSMLLYGCKKVADVTLGPDFVFPSSGTTLMFGDLGINSSNRPEFNSTFHCTSSQWSSIQSIIEKSLISNYRWAGAGIIPDGASLNAEIPSTAKIVRFQVTPTPLPDETQVFENVYKYVSNSGDEVIFRIDGDKFLLGSSDVSGMFKNKKKIEQIIGLENIDLTGVTDMSEMFSGCKALTAIPLGTTNLTGSDLVNMSNMFKDCTSLTYLTFPSDFKTSKVTDMSYMFYNSNYVPIYEVQDFDTSSLTDASGMFYATNITNVVNLTGWDVRKVTSMEGMFRSSKITGLDTRGWLTNSLLETKDMFRDCSNLLSESLKLRLNVRKVKDMSYMFSGCSKLENLDLSGLVNDVVEDVSGMFNGCTSLKTLNIKKFNTSGTKTNGLFCDCTHMEHLTVGEYFFVSDKTGSDLIFWHFGDEYYTSNNRTAIDCPLSIWEKQIGPAIKSTFSSSWQSRFYCTNMAYLPAATDFNTRIKDLVGRLNLIKEIEFIPTARIYSSYTRLNDTQSEVPVYMSFDSSAGKLFIRTEAEKFFLHPDSGCGSGSTDKGMFQEMTSLISIKGLKYVDTREAESMSAMFSGCNSLLSLDLSYFDTSNVTDMSNMFAGCFALTSLDVTKFDTRKVTDMTKMFMNCTSLTTLDVTKFKTDHVTSMHWMFYKCEKLKELDVMGFDTSETKNFVGMFQLCSSLETLYLNNFNFTCSINDRTFLAGSQRDAMFSGCRSMTTLRLSSTFDPRYKENDGSWRKFGKGDGQTTFHNLGIDASTKTLIICSDEQWEVIKDCLKSNGQNPSDYNHIIK